MIRTYIEMRIRTGADRDELAALFSDAGCLGGWEEATALHLFWRSEEWRAALVAEVLEAARAMEGGAGTVVETEEMPDRDWNVLWAKSLEPRTIAGRVVIRQSWNLAPVPPGGFELVIDPRRAFGTGYHATTQLMIEWLADAIRGGERVLDVGTGSGILAMAAVRFGARHATGIDCDPEAIECAEEYAAANGFESGIEFHVAGAEDFAGRAFDVVVANIDRNTILRHASGLCAFAAAGGRLALTGIQTEDEAEVLQAFEAQGYRCLGRSGREEWVALSFEHGSAGL
jgi:ribosomal protein L11 methyltransferase